MSADLMQILGWGYEKRLFTTATLGVQLGDRPQYFTAEGGLVSYRSSIERPKVHDIASLSKLLLAVLVFKLITERERLAEQMAHSGKKDARVYAGKIRNFDVDEPVSRFIRIKGSHVKNLKVRHLLNFHAEFNPFMKPEEIVKHNFSALISELCSVGLASEPGLQCRYANAHSIVLGVLLEKVFGEPLEVLFQKHLIEPLGLLDTTTNPNSRLDRVVCSTYDGALGKVHDPVARMALSEGRLIGSAGLFSSAVDMLKVVDVVLKDGIGNTGQRVDRYIHSSGIEQMHSHENSQRKFAMGAAFWEHLRENLEAHAPTQVWDGLFKSGFTGPAVAIFKDIGAGFALTIDFLGVIRTAEELQEARRLRSVFYLKIGEAVIQAAKSQQ